MSSFRIHRETASLGSVLVVLVFALGEARADDLRRDATAAFDALRASAAENARAVAALPADAERARQTAAAARRDIGLAGSPNFTVMAPRGNHLARRILEQAELFRREAALEWLGTELPDGAEFTHIAVELSETGDKALTLLCGPGRSLPGDHRMWITSPEELATGCTLAHEVTHVVLNARFPTGMPAWANEGIASRRDDERAHAIRRQRLAAMARTGNWPKLGEVLATKVIKPSDQRSYAISTALVEFFLTRGDQPTLIAFVADGVTKDWDAALATHYGIPSVAELQTQWQKWVATTYGMTGR